MARGLKFFDEFIHSGRPAVLPGIAPIRLVYAEGWAPGLGPVSQETEIIGPQEAWLSSTFLPALRSEANKMVILDVENYRWGNRHFADKATVENSRAKLLSLISIYKRERPDLKVGYYAIGPVRDYWRPSGISPYTAADKIEWQEDNREMQEVFDAQDFLCPSVYTFYGDQIGNSAYIHSNIEEAKINANGKPVYAFVWPFYHGSNPIVGNTLIPHEYFRRTLDDIKAAGADGIVFWDGFGRPWAEMPTHYEVIRRFVRDWHGPRGKVK